MSDFKAKMHQVQFQLGLRPRPRWGAYSAPNPLAGFKGPTAKGGDGKGVGNRRVKRGNAEEGTKEKGRKRRGGDERERAMEGTPMVGSHFTPHAWA